MIFKYKQKNSFYIEIKKELYEEIIKKPEVANNKIIKGTIVTKEHDRIIEEYGKEIKKYWNILDIKNDNLISCGDLAGSIVAYPKIEGNKIYKGALITTNPNMLIVKYGDVIRKYFVIFDYLMWYGVVDSHQSDVKLVGDPRLLDYAKKHFPSQDCIVMGDTDFIKPDLFKPLNLEKEYDIIYVAAYALYKRHELFLSALQILKDQGIPVKCIILGTGDQEYKKKIQEMAKDLDVKFDTVNKKEVNIYLNKSKFSIMLSKKEGIPRAISESFAANVPAIVYDDIKGGLLRLVNKQTGILTGDKPEEIAEAIKYMLEHYREFSPRKWFVENTGFFNANKQIKKLAKKICEKNNEEFDENMEFNYDGDQRYPIEKSGLDEFMKKIK